MAKAKGAAVIIKEFFGDVSMHEFKEFWQDCSAEDKASFATRAAEVLGYIEDDEGRYVKGGDVE
jgi:hypothetical protein